MLCNAEECSVEGMKRRTSWVRPTAGSRESEYSTGRMKSARTRLLETDDVPKSLSAASCLPLPLESYLTLPQHHAQVRWKQGSPPSGGSRFATSTVIMYFHRGLKRIHAISYAPPAHQLTRKGCAERGFSGIVIQSCHSGSWFRARNIRDSDRFTVRPIS